MRDASADVAGGAGSVGAAEAGAAGAGAPGAAGSSFLARMRRRGHAGAADPGAAGTQTNGPGPSGGDSASAGAVAVPGGDLAPTVDLSDVRAARAGGAGRSAGGAAGDIDAREPAQTSAVPASAASSGAVSSGSVSSHSAPSGSVLERWRERRESDSVRAAERRLKAAGKQRRARFRQERRRFSSISRARRRVWWVSGGAVVALALFIAAGVFTPLMAVQDVRVEGASTVNQAEISAALGRFTGVPLALVDDAEVHRALEPFPMIQRYAVERVPPHSLVVRIEERVPVLSIGGAGGVSTYDAAGVLLGRADAAPAGVPLASGALTNLTSDAFASAARALRDMPADLRAQIVSATATSAQDVTFTLASGVQVLWGDASETRRKAVVLQAMLTSLSGQTISRIDVSSSEAPVFER